MWVFPGYPLSLIVTVVLIGTLFYLVRRASARRMTAGRTAVVFFAIMYALIVGSAELYEMYLIHKVATFDLNGDGIFSAAESTPEYMGYAAQLTNDAGRRFAPFTGFAMAAVCALLMYVTLRVLDRQARTLER